MQTFRRAPVRVRFVRCSHAALLAVIGLCAVPHNANAQQSRSAPVLSDVPLMGRLFQTQPSRSLPVLGDLPIIGRLFQAQPIARVPVLGNLPIIGGLYRFQPKALVQPETPGKQTSELPLVSLEAKSATLGMVIEVLMDQAHLSYTLDASLEKIPVGSLKLRKVPFDVALRTLLKSASGRATYVHEDGIYRILPKELLEGEQQTPVTAVPVFTPPAADPAVKGSVEILNPVAPGGEPRLNLNVSGSNLYDALKLIFAQMKVSYLLDPALRKLPITAHLSNVPLRTALELLLKGVESPTPLTYRVEDGVYKIVEKAKGDAGAVKP